MDDNDARAIETGMSTYATALDAREWKMLDDVFDETIETGNLSQPVQGRPAFVAMIRRFLDPCGPTQHLLGQTSIPFLKNGVARSVTAFRAFHCDQSAATRVFEVLGRYHVSWRHTSEGWRAVKWRYAMTAQFGDASVLGAPVRPTT